MLLYRHASGLPALRADRRPVRTARPDGVPDHEPDASCSVLTCSTTSATVGACRFPSQNVHHLTRTGVNERLGHEL